MRWEGHRESENVEDARAGGGSGGSGGRGTGLRLGGGRLGLGSVVVAVLLGWALGINPLTILGVMGGGDPGAAPEPVRQAPAARPPAADREARFVSVVLADTEDVWGALFQAGGQHYEAPRLRLFRGSEPTACGRGEAAMGPFYCPGDRKVYIDLSFFETLQRRLGAPGDFAQAYVIAHEVGHHVQTLLGVSERVQRERERSSAARANALSVRMELQADCFAGVWAHHSQQGKGWLEAGDVEEALNAASRIGDDVLQRASGREVVPESFTHGSAAQRQRWFRQGLDTGRLKDCDTFAARAL
jgi:predicted metalloprotease